jgi:peptidyl-prolyl cis-trans isomerase-like 1
MATDVVLETTMVKILEIQNSKWSSDDSQGSIVVELYNDHAPRTCKNFSTLAQQGYYDNVIFHRIIPNFMIQTGDPTGTGRGGNSIYGEKFEDEIKATLKHTGAGVLSMANSGPNTNGSQFFITLAPTPWLDGKHTIFGRVKSGMKIVQRMGLVKTNAEDKPLEQVKIIRARVVEPSGEEWDCFKRKSKIHPSPETLSSGSLH